MDEGICCRPNDRRGFIHKKIAGLGTRLLGIGTSLLPGPLGAVARTGLGIIGSRSQAAQPRRSFRPPSGSRFQVPTPGFAARVQRFLPGGSTGFTTIPGFGIPESDPMLKNRRVGIIPQDRIPVGGGGGGGGGNGCPPEPQVCAPRGFHLNKSSYFLRDGTFIERGTQFVRNRRLNNANGRAQGRAITRLEKGQDNAKKLLNAGGYRTITKQSRRELQMRKRTGHR